MKCFNHANTDAVGLCKNCYKALCHDCCVMYDTSLACKEACEEKVKLLNTFYDQNIYNRYNHTFIVRLVFGIFFVIFAACFYYSFSEVWLSLIFAGLGLTFLALALATKR